MVGELAVVAGGGGGGSGVVLVRGQITVVEVMVSVVTAPTGQLTTVGAQDVTVYTVVVKTVLV